MNSIPQTVMVEILNKGSWALDLVVQYTENVKELKPIYMIFHHGPSHTFP